MNFLPDQTGIFAVMKKVHIGERIRELVRKNKLTDSRFGDLIGLSRPGVQKIYPKEYLDTELLQKISQALDHDFFAEFSKGLGMVEEKEESFGLDRQEDLSRLFQILEKMNSRLDTLESKITTTPKKILKKKANPKKSKGSKK